VFVCGPAVLPRLFEIACIDLHQTGSVGKGSDRLQLIKFWPSRAPGKGVCEGAIFLVPPYYSQRAVFASLLSAFFINIIVIETMLATANRSCVSIRVTKLLPGHGAC